MENQSQQQPPPLVKKRGFFFSFMLFIFGIVIMMLSIIAGIFLYQQTNPTTTNPLEGFLSKEKPSPTTTVNHFPEQYVTQPATAPRTEETATPWRLYKNETYNFSLSFPASLVPTESTYGMGVSTVEFRGTNQDPTSRPQMQLLLFPKALGKLIGQDFDIYYEMANNGSTIIEDTQGASQTFTKKQNRTVSGLRAVDFSTISYPAIPNEIPTVGTYVEIGNNIFIISTSESNKGTLDAVLTTFTYPLK